MSKLKYKVDPLVYDQIGEPAKKKKIGGRPPCSEQGSAARVPDKTAEADKAPAPGNEPTASRTQRPAARRKPETGDAAPEPKKKPRSPQLELVESAAKREPKSAESVEPSERETPPAGSSEVILTINRPRAGERRETGRSHAAARPASRGVSMRDPAKREERQAKLFLRRSQFFVVASFLCTLFVFGILSLVLPKSTRSEYERRELAPMPAFSVHELFWGSYLREVEAHYADTFPFRDGFVQIAARVNELRGVRIDGVRLIETAPAPSTTSPTPEPQTPTPSEPDGEPEAEALTPYEVVDDGAQGEQTENGLFIYHGKAMNIFGGSYDMGTRYATVLNAFAERFHDGARVYNIVVPTSIEFGLPERYKSITNPQKPQIDHIYEQLDGVIGVDAYTALHYHAGEYVYFNTDHHWTALGAYYAYTAFCESAGIEPLSLDDYERRTIEGDFLGTFYSQSYDSEMRNSADHVDYYIPPGEFEVVRYDPGEPNTAKSHSIWAEYATGGFSYSVFLHGDYPLIEIQTGNRNGRSAVVVKESFGNAFAPFLVSHYETVYIVDLRYYEQGLVSLVNGREIDDVIFINNAFAANTRVRIEDLESLMY